MRRERLHCLVDVLSRWHAGELAADIAVVASNHPDHRDLCTFFGVDYEYPDGRFALSMARQQEGTSGRVEEIVHGSDGIMRLAPGFAESSGRRAWRFDGANDNPYVAEWRDLLSAVRNGTHVNEAERVTLSTLAAIMGRIAAYTGVDLTWDEVRAHPLDLRPPSDLAFTGRVQDAIAIPGQSPTGRT